MTDLSLQIDVMNALRKAPSLGKGRSFLLLTSRLALVYLDMVKTGVLCSG